MKPLSRRQTDVAELIAEGLTVAQIAARLQISPASVKSHIGELYAKIGVNNRVAAIRWYNEMHPLDRTLAPGPSSPGAELPVLRTLTRREDLTPLKPVVEQVAVLYAHGLSAAEISQRLYRAVSTVRDQIRKIRDLAGGTATHQQLVIWVRDVYLPWRREHHPRR